MMLLSLTLLAAILSATIAIPRPDGAVDPAGLSSPADAFMTQAPAGDPNVLALADSANLLAPVGSVPTDALAQAGDSLGEIRAKNWYAIPKKTKKKPPPSFFAQKPT